MVRLRLKRLGRKKSPFYRIIVTDKRARRDCAPVAELGYYDPMKKELKLDKDAALLWVSKGALPSETVQRLMDRADGSNTLQKLDVAKKQGISKKAKAKQEALKEIAAASAATPATSSEEVAPPAEG